MNKDKKRMRLLCELAKFIKFEVCISHKCGFFKLNGLKKYNWIRRKYSFNNVEKLNNYKSELDDDLTYLHNQKLIYFSYYSGKQDKYGFQKNDENPNNWTVGLLQDGYNVVKNETSSIWVRAYKQQPATFLQAIYSLVSFLLGTLIGSYFYIYLVNFFSLFY